MTSHETADWRTSRSSAVVVPFPTVDPIVAPWRELYDPSGRAGLVAHVTLLVPFVPPDELEEATVAELQRTLGEVPAFDVEFRRTGLFPSTLFLAPEPEEPFREMTRALVARWPQHQPYGGEHPDPDPHLTLADQQTQETLLRVRAEFEARLPIRTRAEHVSIFVGSNDEGLSERANVPLSQGPRQSAPWGRGMPRPGA